MAKSLLKGNSKKLTKLKGSKSIKDRHKRRAITLTIERVLKKRSKEYMTNCQLGLEICPKLRFAKVLYLLVIRKFSFTTRFNQDKKFYIF